MNFMLKKKTCNLVGWVKCLSAWNHVLYVHLLGDIPREDPDPASNVVDINVPETPSVPPESSFVKLAPSKNRYTLLKDELWGDFMRLSRTQNRGFPVPITFITPRLEIHFQLVSFQMLSLPYYRRETCSYSIRISLAVYFFSGSGGVGRGATWWWSKRGGKAFVIRVILIIFA